jgi:hypothetical protein
MLSVDAGDSAEAQSRLQEAVTLQRELRDALALPISLGHLASLAEHSGDLATCEQLLLEVVALTGRGVGDPQVLVTTLRRLAAVAAQQGQLARAARLLGSASRLSGEADNPDRLLTEQVRTTLSDASFTTHWYEGANSSLDTILTYTLAPYAGHPAT